MWRIMSNHRPPDAVLITIVFLILGGLIFMEYLIIFFVLVIVILAYIAITFIQKIKKELIQLQNMVKTLTIEANDARQMVLKINSAVHLIRRIDLDKYKNEYMNTVKLQSLKQDIDDTVRIYERDDIVTRSDTSQPLNNKKVLSEIVQTQWNYGNFGNFDLSDDMINNQGGGMIYIPD